MPYGRSNDLFLSYGLLNFEVVVTRQSMDGFRVRIGAPTKIAGATRVDGGHGS